MKVLNVVKNASACALVTMLVGCASLDSVSKLHINSKNTGVIYGAVLGIDEQNNPNEISKVCASVKNSDKRCLEQDKYKAVFVLSCQCLFRSAPQFACKSAPV